MTDRKNSNSPTSAAELQNQVYNLLADFDLEQATRTSTLHQHLIEDRAARTQAVGSLLSNYAQKRSDQTRELREQLAENNATRIEEVRAMLHQTKQQQNALHEQLQKDLEIDNTDRILSVAALLESYRVSARENLAEQTAKRQDETAQRRATIQANLAQLRQERLSRMAQRPLAVPPVRPEPTKRPVAPTTKPKPATQAQPELRMDELFLYMANFLGKIDLEELEKYFGAERLYANWESLTNFFEEIRPGSKQKLELLKAQKEAKTTNPEKQPDSAEIFSYLALQADGVSVEEIEQHFGTKRGQFTSVLKKLVETGKVHKAGKFYTAI